MVQDEFAVARVMSIDARFASSKARDRAQRLFPFPSSRDLQSKVVGTRTERGDALSSR
jgi:hypothetical protein